MVHRDLWAKNVLLSGSRVVIADLGQSKVLECVTLSVGLLAALM
jgi:hypothetical protein